MPARKSVLTLFASVVVAGLLCSLPWAGSSGTGRASAHAADKPPDAPRYQVSSWAYGYGEANQRQLHGAYIIDSQTGEVFLVEGPAKPKSLGRVPR